VLEEALAAELRDQVEMDSAPVGSASGQAGPPDLAPEELAQLEERLRSLGYLG
jgi:hypothetical protein